MPELGPFEGAIIGGLLTGILTFFGVLYRDRRNGEKRRQDIRRFLQSIFYEAEALYSRYINTAGEIIENMDVEVPIEVEHMNVDVDLDNAEVTDDDIFDRLFEISHDYFVVYDQNNEKIGAVKDEELREIIVKLYTEAKGMLDTYRANNGRYKEFNTVQYELKEATEKGENKKADLLQRKYTDWKRRLKQHSALLVAHHEIVKYWYLRFLYVYAEFMQEEYPKSFNEEKHNNIWEECLELDGAEDIIDEFSSPSQRSFIQQPIDWLARITGGGNNEEEID